MSSPRSLFGDLRAAADAPGGTVLSFPSPPAGSFQGFGVLVGESIPLAASAVFLRGGGGEGAALASSKVTFDLAPSTFEEPCESDLFLSGPPSSVRLVSVPLSTVPAVCGGSIGTSGRFCLLDASACSVKKHKSSSWIIKLAQTGYQQCLFIRAPGTTSSAFKEPFLDTASPSQDKISELLQATKPVTLWTAVFAMLNESLDDTGLPAEDDDLEGRIAAATTLSKRKVGGFKVDPNEAFLASPPEFVLDPLPSDPVVAQEILGRNLTQMAETISTVVKEVYHLTQDLAHQGSFQNRLCDKTNYLAGLVGSPPDEIKVPSVWAAIMEVYSQLNDNGRKAQPNPSAHLEALLSKHSVAIFESELDRTRLQRELQGIRSLTAQLQRDLPQLVQDEIGPSIKCMVLQELRPIEGLLLQIQQFLHSELPNIRATVSHLNSTQINHLFGSFN
ncbi:hypothetical protein ACA910_019465 [Epithemia clementina (nom. ined.)]